MTLGGETNLDAPVLPWNKEITNKAKVMVVGVGALGNEVLKNLALLDVGQVLLVDFDTIEKSNLSRSVLFREKDAGGKKTEVAAKSLKDINPGIKVSVFNGDVLHDLGLGVYRRMDLVFGCLDNGEARLKVNRCCWKTNTPWVDGGLMELAGTVKVFNPPSSACYECGMTKFDYKLIRLRYSCNLVLNDRMVEGISPTTPTIASITGAMQVQEAFKLLHGLNGFAGKAIVYNGKVNDSYVINFQRRQNCLSHESYEKIIELDVGAKEVTAHELLEIVRQHTDDKAKIELTFEIVTSLSCPRCRKTEKMIKPLHKLKVSDVKCEKCEEERFPRMTHYISGNEKFGGLTLYELGIPLLEIIIVNHNGQYSYFELTKDVYNILN